MLLKEYIKKILKENLEFPNDYIVLEDFLLENGFIKKIDLWKHIHFIKELKRTEYFLWRIVVSLGINEQGKSIYVGFSKIIYVELQKFEKGAEDESFVYENAEDHTSINADKLDTGQVFDQLKQAIRNAESKVL